MAEMFKRVVEASLGDDPNSKPCCSNQGRCEHRVHNGVSLDGDDDTLPPQAVALTTAPRPGGGEDGPMAKGGTTSGVSMSEEEQMRFFQSLSQGPGGLVGGRQGQ